MLRIPENRFFPKNQAERKKLDQKEQAEMDSFQKRMRKDLSKVDIQEIEPALGIEVFPISQKASEYSDMPYGKVSTVGDAGCGPLAMEYAIIANGFFVNFEGLVEEISNKGYRGYIYDDNGNIVDGCGTEYSLFDNTADRLYDVYEILERLRKNFICILIQNEVYHQDPKRKGNHFITLVGIDDEQNAIFMDGNLIMDEAYPDEALIKKPFKEVALGFRGAWAWNKEKLEKYFG